MKFSSPFWHFNGHAQTILPSFFRKFNFEYQRERLELADGDFLDLDWLRKGKKKLIIVTHGLEGDSQRPYVKGIIKKFTENGFDGLAWNCRSCSGELNRLPRFYHHGDANDLKLVIDYVIKNCEYKEIVLAGFSMGGSLTLRYLSENGKELPREIKSATVASVPLDLPSSVKELYKKGKRFYMERFIRKLGVKLKEKSLRFPDHPHLKVDNYKQEIKNFEDFDGRYTAPLHGYKNAKTFYAEASVKPLLGGISIPTQIIQAKNDPFLSGPCFDLGAAESNENLKLIITKKGGHVGFMQSGKEFSFVEERALVFSKSI